MSEDRQPFTIQLFGFLALLGALLIFVWLMTFQDPESVYQLVTPAFFLVGGLSLSFTVVGVRLEPFKFDRFVMTCLSATVNVVVIQYVNSLVPLTVELATMDPQKYAVMMGVAEECFFRLALCGGFYRMTHNAIISIVASSLIWSSYHIAKYGGNMSVLMIVFVCGCVLGATFIYTKSADGSIFGHGIVNYIAYM